MSEPEIKFEIDEYGRIGYRVTNEGVLLSKEEKESIISNILRMQEENAKLRKLCVQMVKTVECSSSTERCVLFSECAAGEFEPCLYEQELRGLGVEVSG